MRQDELVQLEDQLNFLDSELSSKDYVDVHNGSFRQETSQARLDLIHEIDQKLRGYNELFLQHSQLRHFPPVHSRNPTSVANWLYNYGNAIDEQETRYLEKTTDLIPMVPYNKSPLRRCLERWKGFRLWNVWRQNHEQPEHQDKHVIYMSDKRINLFIGLITTVVGLAMLVTPLWVLAFVPQTVYRLTTITVFLIVFLCFVSSMTVAKPFEALGAAAA
jgi:hypothetical protein